MSNVTQFEYQGSPVRTLDIRGETWFVAQDLCSILGLTDQVKAMSRLADSHKWTLDLREFPQVGDTTARYSGVFEGRRNPFVSVVSEPGLYSLVLRSSKPEARKFQLWVVSEILPSIRKTGRYTVPNPAPKSTVAVRSERDSWKVTDDMEEERSELSEHRNRIRKLREELEFEENAARSSEQRLLRLVEEFRRIALSPTV